MDWIDLKNKGAKELTELLGKTKEDLRKLRFDARALKQVHKIGAARKTIARITALLTERAKAVK